MIFKSIIVLSIITLVHSWYPTRCCSGTDCKPVPCDSLDETQTGINYTDEHGKVYEFSKSQINPSEDQYCHVCIYPSTDRPLCVFTINSF